MTSLRTITSSVIWLNVERLARVAAGLIQVAIVARYLGPSLYGDLSTAVAIATMLSGPTALGLDAVLVRRVLTEPAATGTALATAIVSRSIASVLALAGIFVLSNLFYPAQLSHLVLLASIICVTQAPWILESWFRSHTSARPPAISQMAGTFLGLAWRVMAVKLELSVNWLALALAWEMAVSVGVLVSIYMRSEGPRLNRPTSVCAVSLLGECWPMILTAIGAALFARLDVITLRATAGQEQTGMYAAALRIVELVSMIPVSFVTSTTPLLLRVHVRDRLEFENVFARLAAMFCWLGFGLAAALSTTGPFILSHIYGVMYDGSARILQLLAWNLIPSSLAICWGVYWLAERRQIVVTILTFIGAATVYILCKDLAPRFKGQGAAIAILIAQCVPFVLLSLAPTTRNILGKITVAIFEPIRSAKLLYQLSRTP